MKTRAKMFSPRVGRVSPNAPLRLDTHIGVKPRTTLIRRVRDNAPYLGKAAFTLIEMIGVMAIMAILATIMVPNVLRSIEQAALRVESEKLATLGEQLKLYLRANGTTVSATNTPPTLPNWTSDLATFASLNQNQILTNGRQMTRLYVPELAPPLVSQRALIVSSMRTGQALPLATTIRANFSNIWNWVEGSAAPPAGFAVSWTPFLEYLKIERVNYAPDFASRTVTLVNQSTTTTVRYRILTAAGGIREEFDILPKLSAASAVVPVVRQVNTRERLILMVQPGAIVAHSILGILDHRTFEFSDTNGWRTL
jgi:prepilin-type N-terminal cleavage/methylation domain-containing protein